MTLDLDLKVPVTGSQSANQQQQSMAMITHAASQARAQDLPAPAAVGHYELSPYTCRPCTSVHTVVLAQPAPQGHGCGICSCMHSRSRGSDTAGSNSKACYEREGSESQPTPVSRRHHTTQSCLNACQFMHAPLKQHFSHHKSMQHAWRGICTSSHALNVCSMHGIHAQDGLAEGTRGIQDWAHAK